MTSPAERVAVLIEALPHIQRFAGKTVVVKYGGAAMVDDELRRTFAQDIVLLKHVGIFPVIVHGGGPQIGAMLTALGIESTFVQGQRLTDDRTMDVVEMVLVGDVNQGIVGLINAAGGRAVGLSGKDGGLLRAERIKIEVPASPQAGQAADRPPEIIDPGNVGEVVEVRPEVVRKLEEAGFISVIAPVGQGPLGATLNINADQVAGEVAAALKAEKLVLLTDVQGLLDESGELIPRLDRPMAQALYDAGTLRGGMVPKVRAGLTAVEAGVPRAHIIDGRAPHAVLLELFTDEGIGTMIHTDGPANDQRAGS